MKIIKAKNIKPGQEYYFVDTDFSYLKVKYPRISKQKIYQVIGNQYSTKNDGDRYEVERVIGFKTEAEALKYAIKRVQEFKKWVNKDINECIAILGEGLTHTSHHE